MFVTLITGKINYDISRMPILLVNLGIDLCVAPYCGAVITAAGNYSHVASACWWKQLCLFRDSNLLKEWDYKDILPLMQKIQHMHWMNMKTAHRNMPEKIQKPNIIMHDLPNSAADAVNGQRWKTKLLYISVNLIFFLTKFNLINRTKK